MDMNEALMALDNPIRRRILVWLKDRSNFPPPLPEHADVDGVCVGYIQEKAGVSQSTISTYMSLLKRAGLVVSERHGRFTFYRRNEPAIRTFLNRLGGEIGQGGHSSGDIDE